MHRALSKTFYRLSNAINNYLHLGNDPFDILQVLFMLLAVKKKVKLNFTEDKVNFFETDDEILNNIHYAASIFPNQVFGSLKWLYEDLIMIPESDFDKVYRELLYGCINRGIELTNITPSPILYTIASYIHKHNYKSVINVPSGLPYLSIHLSSDIKYLAVEQRIYL